MAYVIKPCRGCGGPKDRIGRGSCYCTACRTHIDGGPTVARRRGPPRNPELVERQRRMVELYRSGLTLEEIGALYSITRERVRQLITQAGASRQEGGARKRGEMTREAKKARSKARRDAIYIKSFGLGVEAVLALNGGESGWKKGTVARAYISQKRSAKNRGIAWEFTFDQWLKVWQDSGHLAERGQGADKYVMARRSDRGAYRPGNVYITTLVENVKDYYRGLRARGLRHPTGSKGLGCGRGWSRHGSKSKPYRVDVAKTYIGNFATEQEAVAAYRQAVAAILAKKP